MRRFFTLCVFILFGVIAKGYSSDLVLFTSKTSSFNEIDLSTLRNFYLGREKFLGKHKIEILDFTPSQEGFLKNYVRKDKKLYKLTWRMQLFTGKSLAPKIFKNKDDLVKYVLENKNVLAYAPSSILSPSLKSIKIVK